MAVPTTLAEAPMGVPLPPMSVPRARAQASGGSGIPAAARLRITGIIVAAKGMLSTMAEEKAETQRMMVMTMTKLPPETRPMKSARALRAPVCSSPPTQTNSPKKKSSVCQSTLVRV